MVRFLVIALLAAISAAFIVPAGGERVYVVHSNFPVKALVNGVEKVLPAYVGYGDLVCVPEHVYLDDGVRISFRGWEGGGGDPCVRVYGNITASYVREFLVHVYAQPQALRRSYWVEEGSFLKLDYPEVFYESEGVRWVFQAWSWGETPFQPSNRLYVAKPMRVEAQYVMEFRVLAVATHGLRVNGSGWYREREVAVVAGPREVYLGNLTRLVLVEWVSAGSVPAIITPQPSGVAVLEVRGPHVVLARYRVEHYVSVSGPQGLIYSGWVGEGEGVKLSTPEYIQTGQDTRLRFSGWRGVEGSSMELSFMVPGPVRAEAVYVKQYLLSVSSPVGAGGGGWYDEGSKAVVTVPENPPANIFIKRRLTGFSGDCGECVHSRGVMALVMDRPRTIQATYASEPDIMNLGIVGAVAAAGGIAYMSGRGRGKKAQTKVGGEAPVICEVCGSNIPAGAIFCQYCGSKLAENRASRKLMTQA